ncbi:MAG: hypothetical protein JRG76_16475 [Deltaproteobacteria bacterium]|nr:hypothetical protein [Deltaproteobacteria bacterium]
MKTGLRARDIVAWLVLTSCLLALAEHALRDPRVYTRLPVPEPYYRPGVVPRGRSLDVLLTRVENVDVLFIGSSIVRTNVRPFRFDKLVSAKLDRPVVSFNGGLSALRPDPTRLYLERFWLDRARPKVVVQGVRLGDMLSTTPAESDPFLAQGRVEQHWMRGTVWSDAVGWLISEVRMLQYQGALQRLLDAIERRQPYAELVVGGGFPVDKRGWERRTTPLAARKRSGKLKDYRPYDNELDRESLRGGLEALGRAARSCRERGVRYVVANVPEHAFHYGRPDGKLRYAHYLESLRELAEEEGFLFVDVTDGDLSYGRRDSLFSDYGHMRPKGARWFTEELARRLITLLRETLDAPAR